MLTNCISGLETTLENQKRELSRAKNELIDLHTGLTFLGRGDIANESSIARDHKSLSRYVTERRRYIDHAYNIIDRVETAVRRKTISALEDANRDKNAFGLKEYCSTYVTESEDLISDMRDYNLDLTGRVNIFDERIRDIIATHKDKRSILRVLKAARNKSLLKIKRLEAKLFSAAYNFTEGLLELAKELNVLKRGNEGTSHLDGPLAKRPRLEERMDTD